MSTRLIPQPVPPAEPELLNAKANALIDLITSTAWTDHVASRISRDAIKEQSYRAVTESLAPDHLSATAKRLKALDSFRIEIEADLQTLLHSLLHCRGLDARQTQHYIRPAERNAPEKDIPINPFAGSP